MQSASGLKTTAISFQRSQTTQYGMHSWKHFQMLFRRKVGDLVRKDVKYSMRMWMGLFRGQPVEDQFLVFFCFFLGGTSSPDNLLRYNTRSFSHSGNSRHVSISSFQRIEKMMAFATKFWKGLLRCSGSFSIWGREVSKTSWSWLMSSEGRPIFSRFFRIELSTRTLNSCTWLDLQFLFFMLIMLQIICTYFSPKGNFRLYFNRMWIALMKVLSLTLSKLMWIMEYNSETHYSLSSFFSISEIRCLRQGSMSTSLYMLMRGCLKCRLFRQISLSWMKLMRLLASFLFSPMLIWTLNAFSFPFLFITFNSFIHRSHNSVTLILSIRLSSIVPDTLQCRRSRMTQHPLQLYFY